MYQQMTSMPTYADKYGFVALFPTSKSQNGMNCWDIHSEKSLKHDGGGDSQGLVGIVQWALQQYNGDPNKVFVVGGSSGAMATNVLAATYPSVFNAGVSYSGVPAACWAGSPISTPRSSDLTCPLGQKAAQYSAQKWAELAKGCYPGYNGTRPRMMIVHGTADTAVVISNLKAQLDQWSEVLGIPGPPKNISDDPLRNWKKIVYGDGQQLVGYEVQGGGHIPPFQGETIMKFFGFA
jgi:acetylxylan esterase